MAHYRNITVNGVKYQYAVGDVNIVIRGLGVFPKSQNSDEIATDCGCGCGNDCTDLTIGQSVGPKHIRAIIERSVNNE